MSSTPLVQTIVANDITVAFTALLWYDYTLTLGDEIQFVWQQKMSLSKILFLLNRYIPMADLIILSNSYANRVFAGKFCVPWFHVDNWVAMLNVLVVDILLLLRVWSLWRRSRTILIFLIVLLALCMMAAAGTTIYASLAVIPVPSLDTIRSCAEDLPRADVFYGVWVSFIVFDTAIVVLTLIKALPALTYGGFAPVLTQLLRDGVLYFITIFLISIANVIVLNVAPPVLSSMLATPYRVLTALLCSRLVLNLHGSVLLPEEELDLPTELDDVVFNSDLGRLVNTTRHTIDDVEDPEGAVDRRRARGDRAPRFLGNSSKAGRILDL